MSEEKQNTETNSNLGFGITSETKASNNTPLLVASKVENDARFPSGWAFPVVRLISVTNNPVFEKKDGSIVSIITFIFKDADNRQYTHIEWEIDSTDSKYTQKIEGLNVRIKHIYTVIFNNFPANGVGSTAKNYKEYFKAIADAFNSVVTGEGENIKKVYLTVQCYCKVIFYKANLGFPLSPNFLEKVIKDKPCKTLSINKVYDHLSPTVSNTKNNGIPGMSAASNTSEGLPTFDDEFE